MANGATSGAISGGASGAAAGTSIMPGWGTLIGGIAGAGMGAMGGMAADRAEERAKRLRHLRESAARQMSHLEQQANAEAEQRLRQLAAQRYASYGALSQQLGGPERTAAGQQAGVDFQSRLGSAMGGVNLAPVGNRALVGGAASEVPINAQLDPLLAARQSAIMQNRIQGGLSRYDTGALNEQQNANITLGRQAGEEMQRQNALAEIRRRMLEQAKLQFRDRGPTNVQNDTMLASQLGLAGLHTAGGLYGSYRAGQPSTGASDGLLTTQEDPGYSYSHLLPPRR